MTLKQRMAVAHLKVDDTKHLPNKVELAIGMKVMVLENISPNASLANGSCGIITDILLDPKEIIEDSNAPTIWLQYRPAAILFKPFAPPKIRFQGLPLGVVPIFPLHKKFKLGDKPSITLERTPVCTHTGIHIHGLQITRSGNRVCVIVDIAKPPSGALTAFNTYVSLSRSRGRHSIRLLCDFDEKLFTTHPNEELRKEDLRLEQ